jgi:hypothetical protein
MKEFLINCGAFNIIVVPERRQYFVLDSPAGAALLAQFLACEPLACEALPPYWFRYTAAEVWSGFDGSERRLNEHLSESELIDQFVLKKFNFGSLVAVRDLAACRLQVFKRDKLPASAVGS